MQDNTEGTTSARVYSINIDHRIWAILGAKVGQYSVLLAAHAISGMDWAGTTPPLGAGG